ncbi:MAG: hypothetical protein ABI905_16150 [Betaproteobacteria bacterium]
MSKELNLIEEAVVATEQVVINNEPLSLNDLSLALVGGGECVVTF